MPTVGTERHQPVHERLVEGDCGRIRFLGAYLRADRWNWTADGRGLVTLQEDFAGSPG